MLLLWIVTEIPDWKSRLDFWLEAARRAGDYTSGAAAMIGSPYFGIGLVAAGISWLIFVGEPQRGVQRHNWLPYLGWSIVALCFTAIVVTSGWGAIQIYTNEKVEESHFWYLSESQRLSLGKELRSTMDSMRFPVRIMYDLGDFQSATMANDLNKVFIGSGWKASKEMRLGMDPTIMGIDFVISKCPLQKPFHSPLSYTNEIAVIFNRAKIPIVAACMPDFDEKSVLILVGSRP